MNPRSEHPARSTRIPHIDSHARFPADFRLGRRRRGRVGQPPTIDGHVEPSSIATRSRPAVWTFEDVGIGSEGNRNGTDECSGRAAHPKATGSRASNVWLCGVVQHARAARFECVAKRSTVCPMIDLVRRGVSVGTCRLNTRAATCFCFAPRGHTQQARTPAPPRPRPRDVCAGAHAPANFALDSFFRRGDVSRGGRATEPPFFVSDGCRTELDDLIGSRRTGPVDSTAGRTARAMSAPPPRTARIRK